MSRTTRTPNPALRIYLQGEEMQAKHVQGRGPSQSLTLKDGKRVGPWVVGGSKSPHKRGLKKLAKRRSSKRLRQHSDNAE